MTELHEIIAELKRLPRWVWVMFAVLVLVGIGEMLGIVPTGMLACPLGIRCP